jgi:hypothetical protein
MRKKYPAYFTNPCGFLLSMKHRGEIVEKAITQSNVPISAIARAIGYDRRSIYNFFDNPDLSLDIIVKIGKAINYDFRKDFPELFIQEPKQAVQEPEEHYSTTLSECLKEKKEWRDKYYSLLEENKELMTQLLALKK